MTKSMPPEVAAAVRNIRKARAILHDWGWDPEKALRYLVTGNLIVTPPRIILTRDELANLDSDALVFDAATDAAMFPMELDAYEDALPAVVIATGGQVRAARQALEATE